MKVVRQTYRPSEVATVLHIGISTVYRRIREGRIPALMDPMDPDEPLLPIRIPIEQFHRLYPDLPAPSRA